jgi:Co/Zn/Cd efflux system component
MRAPEAHDHGDRAHGHADSHSHALTDFGRAFAFGSALNSGFVILEVVFGFRANSVALLADEGLSGVTAIHDLHIWPMSTTETALIRHLVMPAGPVDDAFIAQTAASIERVFGITHSTLQIERGDGPGCALEPDHVV